MAGNITIIEPTENFQRVSKQIIFNPDVDAFTLGVYVKVLCLGVEWDLNVNGLAKVVGCSADRIRRVFAVLEEAGFLRRSRAQDAGGHFTGWDYEVSAEPITDQVGKTPTSVNHRRRENTDVGKTPTSEKIGTNKDINKEIETIKENKDYNISISPSTNRSPSFSLRSALLAAGVTAEVADAWLAVRKAKKAVNTELAWKAIEREIQKSGRSADECIRFSAERSWAGFKADWIKEEDTRKSPSSPTPSPKNASNKARLYDFTKDW